MYYWILYFYLYGFIGWIYESVYVSLKTKEPVNRGFLHGPLLPIYGFGGVICVLCGLFSNYNIIITFASAIIICTTMELFTGLSMERLFKVRYWNYFDYPFNYKGYICLYVSLFWGILALVVSFLIHPAVSPYLYSIPLSSLEALIHLLLFATTIDVITSYSEAINLRNIYDQFSDINSKLISLQNNIENIQSEIGENLDEIRDKLSEIIDEERIFTPLTRIEESINRQKEKQFERISNIKSKISEIKSEKTEVITENADYLQDAIKNTVNKNYSRAVNIMKRNPAIMSTTYDEQRNKLREKLAEYKRKQN